VGVPQVQPSTDRWTTWSAPGSGSASSSSALIGVPSQSVFPIRSPPTSLDTQASVTYRSIIGRFSSSANVRVIGLRTIPWIRSSQVSGSTCGG
jgi:hypothetical protein